MKCLKKEKEKLKYLLILGNFCFYEFFFIKILIKLFFFLLGIKYEFVYICRGKYECEV